MHTTVWLISVMADKLSDFIEQFARGMHGNMVVSNAIIGLVTQAFCAYYQEMAVVFSDWDDLTYNLSFAHPSGEIYIRLRRVMHVDLAYIHGLASTLKMTLRVEEEAGGRYTMMIYFKFADGEVSRVCRYPIGGTGFNMRVLLIAMLQHTRVEDYERDDHRLLTAARALSGCKELA